MIWKNDEPMSVTRVLCLTWVLIPLCMLLIGWADNWDQIRQQSEKISTISARFIQKKEMKILAKPLISEGRFYFNSPDSVRWEYMTPVRSILLLHRGDIHRYVKGEKGFIEDIASRCPA